MPLTVFFKYISYDTQSDEQSDTYPSSEKQKVLGAALAEELNQMGLHNAHMDEYGYVYGWLPASAGCEGVPCVGLISHMDTSPDASGADIKPRIVRYEGGDLVLNEEKNIVMKAADFESLAKYVGQDLIVTDGTTLLGADDKAGIAEIFSAVEYLMAHPEIPHGRIAVCITPNEEVGGGTDHFDVPGFGAAVAYTVDGGELGELEYENFNAANATVVIHGVNIHPGSAKNKMKNALLIGLEFAGMMPPAETPAHTEGYEGFYHLNNMSGNETETQLHYIIRDHDMDKFQARKAYLGRVARLSERQVRGGHGGAAGEGQLLQYAGEDRAPHVSDSPGPVRHGGRRSHPRGGAHPGRHRRGPAQLQGAALSQPVHRRRQFPRHLRVHPAGCPGQDDPGAGEPGHRPVNKHKKGGAVPAGNGASSLFTAPAGRTGGAA